MQPLIIGLTGSIAAGKSTAEKFFAQHGASIIDADQIVKQLYIPGQPTYQKILKYFTQNSFTKQQLTCGPKQILNTKFLKKLIFTNPKYKKFLEQLTHPQVQTIISQKINQFKSDYNLIYNNKPNNKIYNHILIVSIPLLLERDKYPLLDKIIFIDIPAAIQRKRLISRDKISEKLADQILAGQPDRSKAKKICDNIIDNNKNIASLQQQIQDLTTQYFITINHNKSQ